MIVVFEIRNRERVTVARVMVEDGVPTCWVARGYSLDVGNLYEMGLALVTQAVRHLQQQGWMWPAALVGAAVTRGEDSAAAEVNRGQQDDAGESPPAGVAAAPTGQAGGAGDTPLTVSSSEDPPRSAGPPGGLTVIPGGRELLRIPKGVTPAELRAHGFPDAAAALAAMLGHGPAEGTR